MGKRRRINKKGGAGDEETCAICLEEFKDGKIVTSCKHHFHEDCLKQWSDTRPLHSLNYKCPECRKALSADFRSPGYQRQRVTPLMAEEEESPGYFDCFLPPGSSLYQCFQYLSESPHGGPRVRPEDVNFGEDMGSVPGRRFGRGLKKSRKKRRYKKSKKKLRFRKARTSKKKGF